MAAYALLFGGLLVVLGLVSRFNTDLLGASNKSGSPTALIPAFIGGLIMLCGIITLLRPALRKHIMHLAALSGVLGFVGGFVPLGRGNFDFGKASVVTGILMSSLSFVFVLLCVKSFIDARKARQQSDAPASGS